MSAPTLTEDEARRTIEAIEECMAEGLPLTGVGGEPSARQEAARRLGTRSRAFHQGVFLFGGGRRVSDVAAFQVGTGL